MSVALQVRGARDPGAARRGLRAARRAIDALVGESATVSPVVSAPGGPLLVVTPQLGVETLLDPDALVEVAAAPVREADAEAHVASLDVGGVLDRLDATPNAVALRLFGSPAGPDTEVPTDWLDVASEWVLGDLHALDTVRVRLLGVPFVVPAPDAVQVLHDAREARAWCDVVQGDLDDRIRTASLTFGPLPHLTLAGGGPGALAGGLLDRFTLLRDVARELAGTITWASLTFDRDFGQVATGLAGLLPVAHAWPANGGAPANTVAAWLCDERVPGVYAHQVLSPRHLTLLGRPPEGSEALGDDRVELTVGEPSDWLGGELPVAAYDAAVDDLEPLLVRDDEVDALLAARSEPERNAPSLDAIVLESSPHRRRSNRVTFLELVAWLDGQPHSNHPQNVSLPLSQFGRWLSLGLDAVRRQNLRPLAPAVVGSARAPAVERVRAWAIARWLVDVMATTWLRQAGMGPFADRLAGFDPTDPRRIAEVATALSEAAVACHQRLLHSEGPHDAAWEVWEAISGPSGWVAAAEAGVADAPPDVAAAADQRVVEVVRNQAASATPADAGALVNEVWSVTLGALADHLWVEGWRAADAVASTQANTDLLGLALGTRSEIWDSLTDGDRMSASAAAHDAARGPLARVGLDVLDAAQDHPWDLALLAAAGDERAASWWQGLVDARSQTGEAGWEQAMAAARARVDEIGSWAPDAVSRARLVAVTREAAGAAARLAATVEIADAQAAGRDDPSLDKCVDEAIDALAPVTDQLGRSATWLLRRLLNDEPPRARRATLRRRRPAPRT